MALLSKTKNPTEKAKREPTAKEIDKERVAKEKYKAKKAEKIRQSKQIKKTVTDTIPYERVVSGSVILVKSGVKVGKSYVNIYSKTYLVPDINYSSATKAEQEQMFIAYEDLLNGFDSMASFEVTIHNNRINKKEFENKLLLKDQKDELDDNRHEFNEILHDKLMLGQNGIQCKKYFTVSVYAVDLETAFTKFLNYEAHISVQLTKLQTELIELKANDRVRVLADIFCDVDTEFEPISKAEFAREAEKQHCCPTYFDFSNSDYFLFDKKYARVMYFDKIKERMSDDIFKSIVETNVSLLISKHVSVIDTDEALKTVRRQITDMTMEKIQKTKHATPGVDPIQGTPLGENLANANEYLSDLQSGSQKMTLCKFVVMLIADNFAELEANTEKVEIICRKYDIKLNKAAYRQEQGMATALPLGNPQLKIVRTLSTRSTAVFMPFNARNLNHEGGFYYGLNKITNNILIINRRFLSNPNAFILGVPGSGKSFAAKMEMINSILATNSDVLILDPEREYTALATMFGGEVIYISENSQTHINPLDLTEQPLKLGDPDYDPNYDPIKAKADLLQSFFTIILEKPTLEPVQKTIVDDCLRRVFQNGITYDPAKTPTLVDYYNTLAEYATEWAVNDIERAREAKYLLSALHLYVHGSMNNFSHRTNVNIKKRVVVYDIKELGKNLQTLGMLIVLENLWDKVAKNRSKNIGTRIYIDEMYLLFKSEQCADFFYVLYKRARKWGSVPTAITQNVEDLLRSEQARAMLSNTQFVLMLNQNATDREKLAELLHISPETMSYVTRSDSGSGLIYADKFGVIPFYNQFPTDTELYRIMSTKFNENITM